MKKLITVILLCLTMVIAPHALSWAESEVYEWELEDGQQIEIRICIPDGLEDPSPVDQAYRRALEPGARDCYSYGCDGCENCY